MQYFGGKSRIASRIVDYISPRLIGCAGYLEPFVGSCSVIEQIKHPIRIASDNNKYLISMWGALLSGWIPPTHCSELEYANTRDNRDVFPELAGFIGFGCSFSGKWFGGYARDGKGRNYCLNASNSVLHSVEKLVGVKFCVGSYEVFSPSGYVIYCDPPYLGTTGYSHSPKFSHTEFWNVVRGWSRNNFVITSEYVAPNDFVCVLEIPTKLDIRDRSGKRCSRVEKLFVHRDAV